MRMTRDAWNNSRARLGVRIGVIGDACVKGVAVSTMGMAHPTRLGWGCEHASQTDAGMQCFLP